MATQMPLLEVTSLMRRVESKRTGDLCTDLSCCTGHPVKNDWIQAIGLPKGKDLKKA
jgi:hypothetical protein